MQYSKTLAKLSSKLLKLTKESASSVNTAWQRSAVEMETQSEVHRSVITTHYIDDRPTVASVC